MVAASLRFYARTSASPSPRACAIDGLHTCGLGQRMGIFSGPGVGKSTLMSWIVRHTSADISVIALIGERAAKCRNSSKTRSALKDCRAAS